MPTAGIRRSVAPVSPAPEPAPLTFAPVAPAALQATAGISDFPHDIFQTCVVSQAISWHRLSPARHLFPLLLSFSFFCLLLFFLRAPPSLTTTHSGASGCPGELRGPARLAVRAARRPPSSPPLGLHCGASRGILDSKHALAICCAQPTAARRVLGTSRLQRHSQESLSLARNRFANWGAVLCREVMSSRGAPLQRGG